MASSSQSPVDPETSKPTIQNVVDRLTKSENLLKDVNMLDSLTKLIAALKDIDQFLLKFGHNNVVGARLETVLERIHILSNNLGTYDGQKFALPAEQLQEEFDSLNEIVSKLMSQSTINPETSKPTIQNVVDSLTKFENLLKDVNMLASLTKLIADLKNIEQFLMKYGQNTVDGAQLKTVLDRIHILSNSLGTYDGQKFALPTEQLQAEFDILNEIVSKQLMPQPTINPETSKPTIQNVVDRLTKSENLLKDVNMLNSSTKLIAGLRDIDQFLLKFGHNNVVGARLETVLEKIHILSNNLGTYDGQKFALPAKPLQEEFDSLNEIVSKLMSQIMVGSSQLTVNKEISESIIPKLVDRLTKVEKLVITNKGKGCDDKANMLKHLKKLIANLNEIKEFFMNSGHDTAEGAQVKNVLERILDGLPTNLETICDLIVALRAVPKLKADFDKLNEIVSKLKLQETIKSKILYLANQISTEAENLKNSNDSKARGVLVKTVLERIVPAKDLYDLRTDGNGKKVDDLLALKDQLDLLNQTVTRLKHQAPLVPAKSGQSDSTTVSEISENIIPGVVTRLELANLYSLSGQGKQPQSAGADTDTDKELKDLANELKKLTNDLSYIRSFLKNMEDNSKSLSHRVVNFESNATVFVNALIRHSDFQESSTELQDQELKTKIRVLNKVVIKLKHQISSSNKLSPTDSDADWYKKVMKEFDYSQVLDILPVLHNQEKPDGQKSKSSPAEKFKSSLAFRDFQQVYKSLELTTKLCLLCFAVIPENEVVKKRFMTHWWVGEGFISSPDDEAANQIFNVLVKENCIEPVDKKYKLVVDSYKMNPLIRSAVILLAKEAQFFDFDEKNNPSAIFHKSYRACLVDAFKYGELFKSKIDLNSKNGSKKKNEPKRKNEGSGHGPGPTSSVSDPGPTSSASDSGPTSSASDSGPKLKLDAEKVQVIFNVNEPYPDVFDLEWFSKLKNVKVLYLGRWQTSAKHHIEVEGTEFLIGLKSMKLLRFLSLQGISRITKLPDSVCKLLNLRILDLRACHNLEAIPNGIGSLKRLAHLDISECYLVDSMPKGISSLSKLQVLKGFVISHLDSRANSNICRLEDLSRLPELRKLSIYTNSETFPEGKDVTTLVDFEGLQKLTITWGAGAFPPKSDKKSPGESEEKKRQARDAAQPIAAAVKSPEESEEKKRQARDAAQPIAAAAKSPEESEEKKRQARDAAQPIAATAKSPDESEDKKRQDRDAAQPIAATAKSPEESEEKKRQDRDAAQPIAATAKSPEESEDKKRQARDAAQPIPTTSTTTLKNSGDNKNDQDKGVSQPRERSTMNLKNVEDLITPPAFKKLEKLDLKCYPRTTQPNWLHPRSLPDLNKLYIRGGTLQNLSGVQENVKWLTVKVLRLKFLSDLKMDYKKLRSSFPSLIYLENFECPKLTYFPCNEKGVIRLKAEG